jgi:hypothetical protein
MKTNRLILPVVSSLLAVQVCAADPPPVERWRLQLEQDWLLQARVEAEGQRAANISTRDDAAGGCDGVTNGRWGFHTGEQENPWWQVDLGEVMPLAQVRVWNRADNDSVAARASRFQIHLSDDGTAWRQVYQHDGTVFYGYHMPDRSPLAVKLTNAAARFVRIRLPGKAFLHLDEVEVLRAGGGNVARNKPADQSSVSQWSVAHRTAKDVDWRAATARVLENCERLRVSANPKGIAAFSPGLPSPRGYPGSGGGTDSNPNGVAARSSQGSSSLATLG